MKTTKAEKVVTIYDLLINQEEIEVIINGLHWKIIRIEEKYKLAGNDNEKYLQELRYELALTKKIQRELIEVINETN